MLSEIKKDFDTARIISKYFSIRMDRELAILLKIDELGKIYSREEIISIIRALPEINKELSDLKAQNERILNLENKKKEYEKQISEINFEKVNLEKKLSNLEKELKQEREKNNSIESLKSSLASVRQELKETNANLREEKARTEKLEKYITEIVEEYKNIIMNANLRKNSIRDYRNEYFLLLEDLIKKSKELLEKIIRT